MTKIMVVFSVLYDLKRKSVIFEFWSPLYKLGGIRDLAKPMWFYSAAYSFRSFYCVVLISPYFVRVTINKQSIVICFRLKLRVYVHVVFNRRPSTKSHSRERRRILYFRPWKFQKSTARDVSVQMSVGQEYVFSRDYTSWCQHNRILCNANNPHIRRSRGNASRTWR